MSNYQRNAERMDTIHEKASRIYALKIPSPKVRKIKYKILIKVRGSYETIKKHSEKIYKQGEKLESVLKQLYDPIVETYSYTKLGEAVAREFADNFQLKNIHLDEQDIETSLENIEQDMNVLLDESEKVFNQAMKNLQI